MEVDYFLIIICNGEKRKLLKIRDRPKREFAQITAYLGDGFREGRLGAYKYSIHAPRPGSDENLIHFRATKRDTDDEWYEHRHYTRALTRHDTFAHVFSARYQTLAPIHNGVGARGHMIQLPEELDEKNAVLTLGVYVGKKGVPFEIPSGEYVKIIRIETTYLSFIILYILEKRHFRLRFSQNIMTRILPQDQVQNPIIRAIHEKIKEGCTPEFSLNQFVIHHFDLFRDYWRTWMQEVEARHAAGEVTAEAVDEFRILVGQRMWVIDMAEAKRNREGKFGRYLRIA